MRKITKFDRQTCRFLGDQVISEIETLAKSAGVHVRLGRGRFSSTNYTMKIEFSVTQGETVLTKEREAWKRAALIYGLKEEWLDQKFRAFSGREFQIVGLNPRARRMPVLAKEVGTGGSFKFQARAVIGYMSGANREED